MSRLVYAVHPLPESMFDHVWDYGTLLPEEEFHYISSMLAPYLSNHVMRVVITNLAIESHRFVRNRLDACSVSLRDVARFGKILKYFEEERGRGYYESVIGGKGVNIYNELHQVRRKLIIKGVGMGANMVVSFAIVRNYCIIFLVFLCFNHAFLFFF